MLALPLRHDIRSKEEVGAHAIIEGEQALSDVVP
jgi:hypothetical protein